MIRTSFVEKALVPGAPRSLGRALRQLRGAATPPAGWKPSDGDGDGKMSLAPGLPDETPVPPKPKDIVPKVVEAVSKKPTQRSFPQEYSYERMLKNLDLDAIDADLDKDLTLAELHELVGFPEPDANVRKFVTQGGPDKTPKMKPTEKRKIARGRPAATYRTGDFIDLLKEAKKPKRPVKVKRFAKREVTMEEINAALGDDAMDIGNLSKIVTRLGLKPIRTEQIPRGRPRRIFRSRDAYQVLTKYFDDYGYGTGPYGPRTQIVRSGRTYQKSLNGQSTKILGLGIGKRRPQGGKVRRRRFPKDGDGDGFYSPRPGMPDKTPVPAAMATNAIVDIGEESFSGATATEREISAAIAASKRIEEEVIKEYGEIRTRKQAVNALKKAFPNAQISFLERGAADSEISNTDRNYTIAFLHAAGLKPKAAKRLTSIKRLSPEEARRTGDAGGQKFALVGNTFEDRGIDLLRETSFSQYRGRRLNVGQGAPWPSVVAVAMFNSGDHSVEDIDRVYQQSLVLHEMGHLAHFDAGWDDMTYEGTNLIRNEIFAEALSAAMGNSVEEVNAAAISAAGFRFFETEQEKLSYGLNQLFTTGATYMRGDRAGKARAKRFQDKIVDKVWDRLAWDGTPQEKRAAIAAELGKVSEYGATKIQEGVAETFARVEMTGGSYTPTDLSARKFFRWVLTKEAKMKKEAREVPEIVLSNCTGFPPSIKVVGKLPPKESKKPAPAKIEK